MKETIAKEIKNRMAQERIVKQISESDDQSELATYALNQVILNMILNSASEYPISFKHSCEYAKRIIKDLIDLGANPFVRDGSGISTFQRLSSAVLNNDLSFSVLTTLIDEIANNETLMRRFSNINPGTLIVPENYLELIVSQQIVNLRSLYDEYNGYGYAYPNQIYILGGILRSDAARSAIEFAERHHDKHEHCSKKAAAAAPAPNKKSDKFDYEEDVVEAEAWPLDEEEADFAHLLKVTPSSNPEFDSLSPFRLITPSTFNEQNYTTSAADAKTEEYTEQDSNTSQLMEDPAHLLEEHEEVFDPSAVLEGYMQDDNISSSMFATLSGTFFLVRSAIDYLIDTEEEENTPASTLETEGQSNQLPASLPSNLTTHLEDTDLSLSGQFQSFLIYDTNQHTA